VKLNAISNSDARIYCLGEALWDIIFQNGSCLGGNIGGAMLNSAVTLSRTGLPVDFISVLSKDQAGSAILTFLTQNGIGTDCLVKSNNLQSTIALAFIDNSGDAEYSFYKDEITDFEFKIPRFTKQDILLFGSGWAREKSLFSQIHTLLDHARKHSALIIYDPNYRKKGSSTPAEVLAMSLKNIRAADIVRGSHEDFYNLFGTKSGAEAYVQVQNCGCNYLIYTENSSHVECFFGDNSISVPVSSVEVVNTVGAGDNFNAGIISALCKKSISSSDLPNLQKSDWLEIVSLGTAFGSAVCTIRENYLSVEMVQKIN